MTLISIAADLAAPATARVAACRALLALKNSAPDKNPDADVTQLALELLRNSR